MMLTRAPAAGRLPGDGHGILACARPLAGSFLHPPAEGVIGEVEGDEVVLQGQAVLVRVLIVVGPGGEIDELTVDVADVLHAVPDTVGDADQRPLVVAEGEDVEHAPRRGALPVVVETEAETAAADEEAVILDLVHLPAARHADARDHLVDVDHRLLEPGPARVPDLRDLAPLILLRRDAVDDHALNHGRDAFAFPRHALRVLLRLNAGPGHRSPSPTRPANYTPVE